MDVRDNEQTAEQKRSWLGREWDKLRDGGVSPAEVVAQAGALGLAFLFARTQVLFGAVPLGVGWFCAHRRRLPAVGLGLLLGAVLLGAAGWVYGTIYLFALVVRLLFSLPGTGRRVLPDSERFFSETREMRVAAACLCGVAAAGYQLLVTGPTTASLLFASVMLFACPAGCWLFALALDGMPSAAALLGRAALPLRPVKENVLWRTTLLTLLAAVSFSLRGVRFFGMNVGLVCAAAAALWSARRLGSLWGLAAGGLCAATVLPLYAPAYAMAGLLCGVLWPVGGFFALGLGVSAAAVWSSLVGGLGGFLTAVPEAAVASVLAWPVLSRLGRAGAGERRLSKNLLRRLRDAEPESVDARMMKLSAAFSSLSRLTDEMARTEPDVAACRAVCAEACAGRCGECADRDGCWQGEDAPGPAFVRAAADRLAAGELPEGDLLPPRMRETCRVSDALCEDVRRAAGEYTRARLAFAAEARGTMEYEWVAALLRDAVKADRASRKEDPELTAQVRAKLKTAGIPVEAVSVTGRRKKQVLACGLPSVPSDEALASLGQAFGQICGGAMTTPEISETDGVTILRSVNRPKFAARGAVACRAADPDRTSGDTVRFFDGASDSFCAVLSDGMGTGESARATSSVCGAFAEKMISAGCSGATLTRMLNSLLRAGQKERSATLDLLEVDLLHGEAVFLKAGAAASYVKRGDRLFRVRSRTIPLGLMKAPDTERVRFRAEAGDVFVLLSDGVGQGAEDDAWLTAALAADWGDEALSDTAQRLLTLSREHSDGRDDMTVALLRIDPAS